MAKLRVLQTAVFLVEQAGLFFLARVADGPIADSNAHSFHVPVVVRIVWKQIKTEEIRKKVHVVGHSWPLHIVGCADTGAARGIVSSCVGCTSGIARRNWPMEPGFKALSSVMSPEWVRGAGPGARLGGSDGVAVDLGQGASSVAQG